jgi:uncharacterized protein YigE (DUF2233 family)
MAARASLTAAFLALLLAVSARGAWNVVSSENEEGGSSVQHRRVLLTNKESADEATLHVALFSTKSAGVRVVDNPAGDDLASVMRRGRAIAGVNGGYFDPQNAPLGLLISDGKLIAPFRKARLLSGVLVATKGRVPQKRDGGFAVRTVSGGWRDSRSWLERHEIGAANIRSDERTGPRRNRFLFGGDSGAVGRNPGDPASVT